MERRSQTMAQRMEASFSGLHNSVNRFLGIIGVAGGVAGIGLLVQRSLAAIDSLDEMATRIGINVESLQALQHAADLTGAGTEALETGLRNLNRRIAEAAQGDKAAVGLFRGMGIAVTDTGGRMRATEAVLGDFADKIAATRSPAERTRLAMEAFGRSGTALLPMLEKGRAGLAEYQEEARRLGLVMDASMVKKAGEAADRLATLARIISTNLMAAIGQIVASDQFAEWIKRIGEGLVTLAQGAKALGLLPESTSDQVARLTERIKQLRDEADRIEKGETIGDRINRFFGHAEKTRQSAAELQKILDSLVVDVKITVTGGGDSADFLNLELIKAKTNALAAADASWQEAAEAIRAHATTLDDANAAYKLSIALGQAQANAVAAGEEEWREAKEAVQTYSTALDDVRAGSALVLALIQAQTNATQAGADEWDTAAAAIDHFRGLQRKAAADAKDYVVALQESIEVQRLQLQGRTAEARVLETEISLRERLGRRLLPDERDRIKDLIAEQVKLNKVMEVTQSLGGALETSFDNVGRAVTEFIVQGKQEALEFRNIMTALLTDLLNQLIKIAIIRPLATGISSGLGSLASSIFGPTTTPTAGSLDHLQHGGHLRAGQPAIVGERGTELWWPDAAGRIVPHGAGGGAGGGGVQIIINNTAPGTQASAGAKGRTGDGRDFFEILVTAMNAAVDGGRLNGSMGRQFGAKARA